MATKANPGRFDCYANAANDEPMFVLLGRDLMAPLLVRMWAHMRWLHGEDRLKVAEALQVANEMEQYVMKRMPYKREKLPRYDPFDWLESFNSAYRQVLPEASKRDGYHG